MQLPIRRSSLTTSEPQLRIDVVMSQRMPIRIIIFTTRNRAFASSSVEDGSDVEPADSKQDADAAVSDAESFYPEDVQDRPDSSHGADDIDERAIQPLIPLDKRVVIDV